MCALAIWLWICFAGGIGLLASGDTATGIAAVAAGVVTLVYIATPTAAGRWVIRAVLVALWIAGGILLWRWTVEDWAVAFRIAFAVLGGSALVAYAVYRIRFPGAPAGSSELSAEPLGPSQPERGPD